MIAITVSTNYIDLLPIVYHTNKSLFKKWIFVTSKNDLETIKFLADKPDVVTLFWDFQNERRVFDKGGAIRHAQYYAYENFPDEWYLLIDSDIVFKKNDRELLTEVIPTLDSQTLYGFGQRLDFQRMSDFIQGKNGTPWYTHPSNASGYFQLYRERYFYSTSRDASLCDEDFKKNFSNFLKFQGAVNCYHLGVAETNWKGDRRPGSDFIIDTDIKFE